VSPSQRLQFFTNCSSVGPFHVPFPQGEVLQEQASLAWVPLSMGSQELPANLLQRGLLYSQGHRSCQEPAPAQASREVMAFFGHPTALAWGPPWAMGCKGTARLTMVFSMGCRGISALAPGPPPLPPFFTNLGICRVVSLAYSHSSPLAAVGQQFFLVLKYVITEALPPTEVLLPSLMGLALASSGVHLGASWHWLNQPWGKLLAASQKPPL